MAIDTAGDLFVADSGNNRVIEIGAPLAGTQSAARVFGQGGDFTASGCNRGAMAPGVSTLCAPAGLMLDVLGNLWVADVNNDRVLEYEPPFGPDSARRWLLGRVTAAVSPPRDASGNRPGRLERTWRGQFVRAGRGRGRFEYRSVRGGLGQQPIDGL